MRASKDGKSGGDFRPLAEQAAGLLCIVIALSVLVGWLTGEPSLTAWGNGLPAMRPLSAVFMIVMGVGLAFGAAEQALSRVCGWVVLCGSAIGLGIDVISIGGQGAPLLMPSSASMAFLLMGFVLALGHRPDLRLATASAALAAGAVGTIITLGYLSGLQSLLHARGMHNVLAAPAAIGLVLLSWGLTSRALRRPGELQPRPLAFYLAVLGLAVPLPLFLFAVHAGFNISAAQQASNREQLLLAARRVSQTVDREIQGEFETLQALAASPSLATGNFNPFRAQAMASLSIRGGGGIVLLDRAQSVLMDTREQAGATLSSAAARETVQRVLDGASHSMSGMIVAAGGQPAVVLALPVRSGSDVPYALARVVEPAYFLRVLQESVLPSGWLGGLSDANGRIMARSLQNERFVGELISRGSRGDRSEDVIEVRDLENKPSWQAFAWSPTTGWRSAVWVHKEVVEAPAQMLWRSIVLLALLALAIAAAMAWMVGSLLARSFAVPLRLVASLRSGEIAAPASTPVAEANQLSTTLFEAASQRVATERAIDEVRRFNQGLVEAAPTLLYIFDFAEVRNVYVGPQITTMLGYDAAEVQGREGAALRALFHHDDLDRIAEHHRRIAAAETDGPFEIDYRFRHRDGTWRWLQCRDVVFARDAGGRPTRILGAAQDVTEHKATQDRVIESEQRLASVLTALPLGVALIDSQGRRLLGNAFYQNYVTDAIPSRDPDSASLWEARGDDGTLVGPDLYPGALALRGETVWPGKEFLFHGDPTRGPIWLRIAGVPIRDPAGLVTGAVIVLDDIDQEKKAQLALRQSEERFRFLVERTSDLVFRIGLRRPLPLDLPHDRQVEWIFREGMVEAANDGFARAHGFAAAADVVGRKLSEFMPFDAENTAMARALVEAQHAVVEARTDRIDAAGQRRVMLTSIVGRKEGDCVAEYLGAARDVTERVAAEDALAASELHLRLAQEAAGLGSWELDLRTGESVWSPRMRELIGAGPKVPATRAFLLSRVHPDDREMVERRMSRALSGGAGARYRAEYRIVLPDGRLRWLEEQGRSPSGSGGRMDRMFGVSRDVTDRRQREEQLQLLMREVNHRAKNLLSLVLAIARQTSASDPKEFAARFSDRIQALAANQDLLVQSQWQGIDIEGLVRAQLSHFADLVGTRIRLTGPQLRLKPAAAQGLGLALHELATNAGKYGALSNSGGVVEIEWRVDDAEFAISWMESGGPAVTTPSRKGFGSTVIVSVVRLSVDGEVDLDYLPGGLTWRLTCPAEKAVEQSSSDKPPPV